MMMTLSIRSFTILCFVFVLDSCETSTKQTEEKISETYVSHNLDSLSQLINLTSFKPKSVSWTVKKLGISDDRNPGPTDYKLEALLTFEDTTIARLKTAYKSLYLTPMPENPKTFTFDWLPENYTINKDTAFDIRCRADFFIKSPYTGGSFITNNNDVLLNFCTQ